MNFSLYVLWIKRDEFLSWKCLDLCIYEMKLNDGHFFLGTVIIHFRDKPYQQINFENHSNSVLLCKQGKILSDFHMPCFISFHYNCLRSLLQWNWEMPITKSLNYFNILLPIKNDVRFLFHFHCLGSIYW